MSARKSPSSVRSFVLGALVVVLVLAGAGFVISQASGPQTVGHAMSSVWCDNPSGCITTSWLQDLVVTTAKLADSSVSRQKIQPNAVDSTKVIDSSIKAVDVDSSQVQLRVSGNCPSGSGSPILNQINSDGTVSCLPDTTGIINTVKSAPSSVGGTVHTAQVKCSGSTPTMIGCTVDYSVPGNNFPNGVSTDMIFIGGELTPTCVATVTTFSSIVTTVTAKAQCSD